MRAIRIVVETAALDDPASLCKTMGRVAAAMRDAGIDQSESCKLSRFWAPKRRSRPNENQADISQAKTGVMVRNQIR